MILKLWCKGTNKRECYNGINAEPLTCNIHVLMEEVKNIGKVVGCLIVFWKKSLKVSFFDLKIFVMHWLIGVYNKWYFLCFVTKSIIKVS